MNKSLIYFCLLGILFTACNSNSKSNSSDQSAGIDLVTGLQQLTTLKASDFGKSIRYVPLETNDNCLINNNPSIKVLKDKILVNTFDACLLFNKKDGKFVCSIGHKGDDPEAYGSTRNWVDENEGVIYFTRQPSQLIKYDMKGNFLGKIQLPAQPGSPSYMLPTNTALIGYYTDITSENMGLYFFDKDGNKTDSILTILPQLNLSMGDITQMSVMKDRSIYGNWTLSGLAIIDFRDGEKLSLALSGKTLWHSDGEVRFKEAYNDTIYTIRDNINEPYMVFHTGTYYWPESERATNETLPKKLIIPYVEENNNLLFFQCIQGLKSDNPTLYSGLYDKKNHTFKIAKGKDEIQDDLTHFMPFNPLSVSTAGEYTGFIEALDIMNWLEENRDSNAINDVAFLKDYTDDMNPVVVIVEP